MKHNNFQFQWNFLVQNPKPTDLFLFTFYIELQNQIFSQVKSFTDFKPLVTEKHVFCFSLGLQIRCIVSSNLHIWVMQTWLYGCVVPAPALFRGMLGTVNCYKKNLCTRKIYVSGKSTSFPS